MSLKEKVSAFSVFKGRKATSMTNVDTAGGSLATTPMNKGKKGKKSASASTTPNTSDTSLSSIISKFSGSEKKKQKAEQKKIKKLLKNSSKIKGRPSFLPDSALQSPLNELNGGNVRLKSLRPKGSMSNLHYQLPLKPDPAISMPPPPVPAMNGSVSRVSEDIPDTGSLDVTPITRSTSFTASSTGSTPPLPPRAARSSSLRVASVAPELPRRVGQKRTGPLTTNTVVPTVRGAELLPPHPQPKRRRLTENTSSPKKSSTVKSMRHPSLQDGVQERTEPLPVHPLEQNSSTPYMFDSQNEAARLFECLIHPVKPHTFFSKLWEQKPLLVKRHMSSYNEGWFSTAELDRILREERLMMTENIDVTTYVDGKRQTHNTEGRAYAPVVWDYYQNGCSVRLLNPQTFSRSVWKLLSILQEYFQCCVGANVYLTPPGTQGFAPHWDDIEAFILQLEGKKHWRLYSPRNEAETLPRFSSGNFTDTDIGEPILDVVLEAGDLLYFPRGTIHQGNTLEDAHSLHITLSCEQMNSWGDLMKLIVPQALELAISEDVEFRKSLPRDYLNFMGVAFSDKESSGRKTFLQKIEQLMMKLVPAAPVDAACDQMAKRVLTETLPPVLTEDEKKCSVHGNGERWDAQEGRVRGAFELEPDTEIKIIRKGALRLITEEDKVCIYHNLENTRIYKDIESQYIEITPEMAPAVEALLHCYPEYMKVDNLPMDYVQERVELASALYDKGMVVTREPLEAMSDSGESEVEDEPAVPLQRLASIRNTQV